MDNIKKNEFVEILPKEYLEKLNEIIEILNKIIPLEEKLKDYGIEIVIKDNNQCLNIQV